MFFQFNVMEALGGDGSCERESINCLMYVALL